MGAAARRAPGRDRALHRPRRPADRAAGRPAAGEWRREFAARGITLWQADRLVAATDVVHGGTPATGNPEDLPRNGLTVEHWPVGG